MGPKSSVKCRFPPIVTGFDRPAVLGLAMLAGCESPGGTVPGFGTEGLPVSRCVAPFTTCRGSADAIVPGQIVLRFRDGQSERDMVNLREKYGAKITAGSLPGWERWVLPPGSDSRIAVRRLATEADIKHVTLNFRRRLSGFRPSEVNPSATAQWALAQIRAPEAWEAYFSAANPPGKGVIVAVLDSGVDVRHPELSPNIVRDANGNVVFIDVLHDATGSVDSCRGSIYDWQTAYQNATHPGPDGHGHGTHVSGIIAAVANNAGLDGKNIVGVAPAAQILPVKTMDCNGDGEDWNIAYGIKEAADKGAHIQNLSIGGPEPSPLLEDALGYAMNKGVLVIVAAGNGFGAPVFFPAAYDGVMAVGAVDRADKYQSYSNVGAQLALVAPGGSAAKGLEGILSATPTYGSSMARNYSAESGTSQAAPFVAGVAALIWSRELSLSADQVRVRLLASAKNLGPVGFDANTGWGRLDAFSALAIGDHRFGSP